MSQFPIIAQLSDLLPHIDGNKQIRVKAEADGTTVVCYMVQDDDTFSGVNEAMERECRGITFFPNGRIAARTLHKFFNVGEREDTQPHAIDWSKVVRIMDKRDGSMVTPVFVNNRVIFKTKKSFTTKEAELASNVMKATEAGELWIALVLDQGMTPTFEITSPKFPIVLKYDRDELTLLHIRENVTGRYLTEREIMDLKPPFPVVQNIIAEFMDAHMVSWDKLEQAAKTREGIEGWIIQFDDGEMVKLKTKWYNELHHAVTFTRWRDIARAVCDDKSDDLKGAFALTGRSIEPILQVERNIKRLIDHVKVTVESVVKAAHAAGFDAKTTAISYKDHPQFGLIMTLFRGKEPDYIAWYIKNHLDQDWSLEVVEVNA